MEWLVLIGAVAVGVAAVVAMAGRAARTRRSAPGGDVDEAMTSPGPQHVDLAALVGGHDPDDGSA